jgi:hAT family C-terminal dimerisation region
LRRLDNISTATIGDEYKGERLKKPPSDIFTWWAEQEYIPSMQQFASDHLSLPAMSAETQPVFSDTRLYIIEALECSNQWMKASI